jgi:hypothetical protein
MRQRIESSSKSAARRRSSTALASLNRRFQAFRGSHPRSTRIPEPLRKAVVAALQNGASKSAVQKACGVSWEQMERWKTRYGNQTKALRQRKASMTTTRLTGADELLSEPHQPTPPPRVLSVIDDEPEGQAGVPHMIQPLELRVSGWRIRLSPTGG